MFFVSSSEHGSREAEVNLASHKSAGRHEVDFGSGPTAPRYSRGTVSSLLLLEGAIYDCAIRKEQLAALCKLVT